MTAPLDEVWNAVLDVERVAPCVPGAEVLERSGDDAYKVAIKVKVGPVSMRYQGEVEILERDDEQHRAVMRARAKETRGQGAANATVEMRLKAEGGETHGDMTADVAVIPRPRLLQRGGQGRALRRLGRAGAVLLRAPRRIQITALIGTNERRARNTCAPLVA